MLLIEKYPLFNFHPFISGSEVIWTDGKSFFVKNTQDDSYGLYFLIKNRNINLSLLNNKKLLESYGNGILIIHSKEMPSKMKIYFNKEEKYSVFGIENKINLIKSLTNYKKGDDYRVIIKEIHGKMSTYLSKAKINN